MTATCADCRWWQHTGDLHGMAWGRCRRRAPHPAPHGENGLARALFPLASGADWCGDFQAKDGGPPAAAEADLPAAVDSDPRPATDRLAEARAAAATKRPPRAGYVIRVGELFATPERDLQGVSPMSLTALAREAGHYASEGDAAGALDRWRASGFAASGAEVQPWRT